MVLRISLAIFLILSFTSCKKQTQTPTAIDQNNEVEIPESFLNFYKQFNEDSVFQIDHIVFPLYEKSDSEKWTRENWVTHKPFNNQDGEYSIEFDNFEDIIIEVIQDRQQIFRSERRFSEIHGQWHLIYYKVKTVSLE